MRFRSTTALAAAGILAGGVAVAAGDDSPFGFGEVATQQEIAAIDIDVMPDGRGLPEGSGSVSEGKAVYQAQCAACHSEDLQGVKEAGGAALIGGRGSIGTPETKKTIESYWPYASTVFDYIHRAMPFNAPGSLTADEVYAVTAYILHRADIVPAEAVMSAETLPRVEMPNRDGFIPDPRPDVRNYR